MCVLLFAVNRFSRKERLNTNRHRFGVHRQFTIDTCVAVHRSMNMNFVIKYVTGLCTVCRRGSVAVFRLPSNDTQ